MNKRKMVISPEIGHYEAELFLNQEQKFKFASAAIKTFDLSLFEKFDFNEASKTMLSEFNGLLNLNNPDTMLRRFHKMQIDGTAPESYREHAFKISEGKHVLAGIRHAGGNKEKPFINIWPSYTFTGLQEIRDMYQLIARHFDVFRPGYLSFWLSPATNISKELEKQVDPCLRYLVGSRSKLLMQASFSKSLEVSLIKIKDKSYREWYEKLYKDFHSENSALKDWVPVNDDECMSQCMSDGLLYYIEVNGLKAGLIAGMKKPLLGMSAIYFTEILLSKEFKGQNLAPVAQRKFIEQLPEDIELVWGTIDSKNISSTKTAFRVGRKAIRNEFFLPVSLNHY